jgi:hypothetical protein
MAIQDEVDTLKKQVVHFLTSVQIQALITALGTTHTTLTTNVAANTADILAILTTLQSIADQVEDHETRITALEA